MAKRVLKKRQKAGLKRIESLLRLLVVILAIRLVVLFMGKNEGWGDVLIMVKLVGIFLLVVNDIQIRPHLLIVTADPHHVSAERQLTDAKQFFDLASLDERIRL
jgi:hypothetical protein